MMRWIRESAGFLLAFMRLLLIVLSLVVTVFLGIFLKFIGVLDQQHAFRIRTWWCRVIIRVLGIEIIKTGRPHIAGGTLYVSNHRSLIDPVILFSFIKDGYAISKAEVRGYPVIGKGAELSGVVYVDRGDADSRAATKHAILGTLRRGLSVTLFPEGTISVHRYVLPFRKGGFEACVESGCKVAPIALEYMNPGRDFWLNEHLLVQFVWTFSKWKTKVRIHFFDPVTSDSARELCEKTSEMIQDKVYEFQTHWKPKHLPDSLR